MVIVWAIEVRKLYLSCIETCALVPAGLEDGGITVIIMSLASVPSVPGPEYFDSGWKKVTNASKPLPSIRIFVPEGIVTVFTTVFSLP
jgi:hypothetical protein